MQNCQPYDLLDELLHEQSIPRNQNVELLMIQSDIHNIGYFDLNDNLDLNNQSLQVKQNKNESILQLSYDQEIKKQTTSAQNKIKTFVLKKVVKIIGCSCKKSQCLKSYCQCFANGNMCLPGCVCINCKNNQENKQFIEIKRNKKHSDIKKQKQACQCKKSKCLKKYCQCYNSGNVCGVDCQCLDCSNQQVHQIQIGLLETV